MDKNQHDTISKQSETSTIDGHYRESQQQLQLRVSIAFTTSSQLLGLSCTTMPAARDSTEMLSMETQPISESLCISNPRTLETQNLCTFKMVGPNSVRTVSEPTGTLSLNFAPCLRERPPKIRQPHGPPSKHVWHT